MPKTADTAQDRLDKICTHLIDDVLSKAHQQSDQMVEEARTEAEKIIEKATLHAKQIVQTAQETAAAERQMFEASLRLAARNAIGELEYQIISNLISEHLDKSLLKHLSSEAILLDLLKTLVNGLASQGFALQFEAIVHEKITTDHLAMALIQEGLAKGVSCSVRAEGKQPGFCLRMKDGTIAIEMTAETVKDLLTASLSEELKTLLFKQG